MPTSAILILIAAALLATAGVLWFRRRGVGRDPLVVHGMIVGYNDKQMTRGEATATAEDLFAVRMKVAARLEFIYGERRACEINRLTLDIHDAKMAEWTRIANRCMTVNPTRPGYRAHFAEEIHNLYRMLAFGMENIYKPVNIADHVRREEAQEFCRNV